LLGVANKLQANIEPGKCGDWGKEKRKNTTDLEKQLVHLRKWLERRTCQGIAFAKYSQ